MTPQWLTIVLSQGREGKSERRRRRTQGDGAPERAEDRTEQVRVTLSRLVDDPSFTAGLRYGVVSVAVTAVVGWLWRAARRDVAPIAAFAFVAASAVGLADAIDLPADLVVSLAFLVAGPLLGELLGVPWFVQAGLAVPGSVMLAATAVPGGGWVPAFVASTVVVGGTAAGEFDRRWRDTGIGPVLLAISVAGVYVTTPETKRVLVLLGAALPLPLLGWPIPLAAVGRAGTYAATGVLMWAAALDGATRQSSIVGAAACLGLLVAEPVARIAGRGRSPLELLAPLPRWLWVLPAALAHLGLVFVAARVAGLRADVESAVVIAGALLASSIVVGALLAPLLRRRLPVPSAPGHDEPAPVDR